MPMTPRERLETIKAWAGEPCGPECKACAHTAWLIEVAEQAVKAEEAGMESEDGGCDLLPLQGALAMPLPEEGN